MNENDDRPLDRLLTDALANPPGSEQAVLDGLRDKLRDAVPAGSRRSEKAWWVHTAAAILLVVSAVLLVWHPWSGTESPQTALEPDGKKATGDSPTDAEKAGELTLAVQGPFTDREFNVPFEKTDCPFVRPHSVERRNERQRNYLRVRFQFRGHEDLGRAMRVALSHERRDPATEDERICVDRRFLSRLPLWAGTQEDAFICVAEFDLQVGQDVGPLLVTFSRVRLVEEPKQKPLTDPVWAQAIAAIMKLDDENFEQRESAARELVAMGEPLLPYLEMLGQALSERPDAPPNLRAELRPIEMAIQKSIAERGRAELLASLKEAPKRGGNAYEAPSQRTRRALKHHVSFEFADMPLSKALDSLAAMAGVAIVLDPEVSEAAAAISLRVTDMEAQMALGWIGRLAELDFVARREGVVLTTAEKVRILRREERLLNLPTEPGSEAWTEQEAQRLGSLYGLTNFRLNGPNVARVVDDHVGIEELAGVLPNFGRPLPLPKTELPDWAVLIEKQLDGKVSVDAGLTAQEVLAEIGRQIKVSIVIDPKLLAGQDSELSKHWDRPSKDQPARDLLAAVCGRIGVRISLREQCVFIHVGSEYSQQASSILPLGEALKTGVSPDELRACLRRVVRGARDSEKPEDTEMCIYDVGDIVTDAPIGRIGTTKLSNTELAQLIRNELLSNDFEEKVTSFEVLDNKFVVVNRPEVHARLKAILEALRQVSPSAPLHHVLREFQADPNRMLIVRGRWFLNTDPWTLKRLVQVLDETVRTRRIPPVPPLPWFREVGKKAK